jgi:hypothetical protein
LTGHGQDSAFMESAAEAIGLPIPAELADGVRMHLERMAQMAAPLLAVSIPDDVESAPIFEPGTFEP